MVKFYHEKEPVVIDRGSWGRKWIDYNQCLQNERYISDIENGCGLWATTLSYLYEAIPAVERYGKNIMVLSPIDELEYVVTDREIIGDKFEVKMYGSLNDEQTWKGLGGLLGDIIFKEMTEYVRKNYPGAVSAYREYKNCEHFQLEQTFKMDESLLKRFSNYRARECN